MSSAGELITLDLPLTARHASTVRVVAASLAADCGFNIDEIDDLRLGINEAVSIMTDIDAPPQARLLVEFEVKHATIAVAVRRSEVAGLDGAEPVDELARRILGVVVDSFEIADGSFLLWKSAAPSAPTP
jgi:serine/threonine-protein kinase RsbW